jgi:beta-lactamase regulating signal transducer with metallopeptidase domain
MDADLLRALAIATVASSVAVLLVALLRKPLRAAVGARAAYWLWLLVPAATLASLLPAPSQVLYTTSFSLADQVRSAVSTFTVPVAVARVSAVIVGALAIWAAGACCMFLVLLRRQRSFIRSLGTLLPETDGFQRSSAVVTPMLVGAWNARIIVPLDFEARYSPEERDLVLAHERAHLMRHDAAVNAIASGWLCLFWFNPLIYWALGWIRIDQELACDALVLAHRPDRRRCYANALLKTQLATESGWRMPVGCPWHSNHSLKERIVMLKRPSPGVFRHATGIAAIAGLTASTGYAAWAGQSAVDSRGPEILVEMRMKISNVQTKEVLTTATKYLVHSGELPSDMRDLGSPFACTPFLPGEFPPSIARDAIAATMQPPSAGHILLDCVLRHERKVVRTYAVLAADGQPTTVDTQDTNGLLTYTIEHTVTTAKDRIAEARQKKTDKR